MGRVREHIEAGCTVLDVGANIGNHTVFFTKICKVGEIHAFEPQAAARHIFRRQVFLNDISNVILHPIALGNVRHTASMTAFRNNNLGATEFKADDVGTYRIDRLDNLNIERIGFIKIDIEGSQIEFLMGAENTIKRDLPKIFIELRKDRGEFEPSDAILTGWGYKGVQLDGMNYIYSATR